MIKKFLLLSLIFSFTPLWADNLRNTVVQFANNSPPPAHHNRHRHHRPRPPSHMFISSSKAKFIATSAVGGGKVVNLLLRQGEQIYEATVKNEEGEFLVIIEALNGKLLNVLQKN